jgi:hypothetical protein
MKQLLLTLLFCSPLAFGQSGPSVPVGGSLGITGGQSLEGQTAVTMADANYTMVANEWWAGTLVVGSSVDLTATRNLIAPLNPGQQYVVENNTTGGQSIQLIGASGTGVTIANGASAFVSTDGVNYISPAGTLPSDIAYTDVDNGFTALQTFTEGLTVPDDSGDSYNIDVEGGKLGSYLYENYNGSELYSYIHEPGTSSADVIFELDSPEGDEFVIRTTGGGHGIDINLDGTLDLGYTYPIGSVDTPTLTFLSGSGDPGFQIGNGVIALSDLRLYDVADTAAGTVANLDLDSEEGLTLETYVGNMNLGTQTSIDPTGLLILRSVLPVVALEGVGMGDPEHPEDGDDVSLTRDSAAVMDLNGATPGDKAGSLYLTDLHVSGTCTGCGSGSSGFPITIGSTTIAASSTTTTIAGLTLSSPTMTTPVLGTPTSANLVNATGYTYANLGGTIPTWNQNTTGTASNVSGTPALPNGTTATTQSVSDSSTKLATTQFAGEIAVAAAYPVFNSTVAVTGSTQAANSCSSSATTKTMTGLTTSMTPLVSYSSDPSSLTGWGSTGGMTFVAWPSASNTLSWKVCNQTASSITYSSITFNVGAR